jgi:hypothetical protein
VEGKTMGNVNSPEPKERKMKETNKAKSAPDMENSMKGFDKAALESGVSKEEMMPSMMKVGLGWIGG